MKSNINILTMLAIVFVLFSLNLTPNHFPEAYPQKNLL